MSEDRERATELQRSLDASTANLMEGQKAWRQSVDLVDADTSAERIDQLMSIAVDLAKVRDGLRWARGELAKIEEEVADKERREWEREEAAKLNTAFSDEMVLEGLRRVLREYESEFAHAGLVAHALGCLPTHSDRIRAGQALGRLAGQGKVRRFAPKDSHHANQWGLPEGVDNA